MCASLLPASEGWWAQVIQYPQKPVFADLSVIGQAWDLRRQGIDALSAPSAQALYNYPRIWLWGSSLGLGLAQVPLLGAMLICLALASLGRVLAAETRPGVLLGCLLFLSPCWALALERGNTDLLMFSLLVWACFLQGASAFKSTGAWGLMLFAAILKLYPFAALPSLVRSRPRRDAWTLGAFAVLFAVYLWLIRDELRLVGMKTFYGESHSYGLAVFVQTVLTGRLHWAQVASALPVLRVLLLAAGLGVSVLAWFTRSAEAEGDSVEASLFIVGACLYLGTFALLHCWAYRLIFLSLLAPQLGRWGLRGARGLCLPISVLLVLCCWLLPRGPGGGQVIGNLASLLLFFLLIVPLCDLLKARIPFFVKAVPRS